MNLGVQYYRAPFPEQEHWEADFRRIRESGLDTVQLWVLWSWVEAVPGTFAYDDYDRLVELAEKNRLKVVLSTIAEIQPHWIFREAPGSEMIDNFGNRVVSSLRCECNFGLTPGGCTDHPGVWARMKHFLQETGRHFRDAPNLHGWDVWNELRWNIQADNPVCFCPHTLAAWQDWLEARYGSLEALNAAWKRRYARWEDVMPGKLPDRPYTELMAWQHFISSRADAHGAMRHAAMREVDANHPITAHGDGPSPLRCGDRENYALARGNDWELAKALDGIGCSSFPQWEGIDDAAFGSRIEMVTSAADGKLVWLSELQGGRAAIGFRIYGEVTAEQQQHWLWNGIACGADTILFWCWRDEVFGRESGGFGLAGNDGRADERLAALRITGGVLDRHAALLAAYRPEKSDVGLVFNPQDYYLEWAQYGKADNMTAALTGYARALIRNSIPCRFLESHHLDGLEQCKLVILPHTLAVDEFQAERYLDFVEQGGTLVCESECGAFTEHGFYRYPEQRFIAAAGIVEKGRRNLPPDGTMEIAFGGETCRLKSEQWVTPLALPAGSEGEPLSAEVRHGKGRIVYLGGYPGQACAKRADPEFERLIRALTEAAGCRIPVRTRSPEPTENAFLYHRGGMSGDTRMLFVFFPNGKTECELELAADVFPGNRVTELVSGREFAVETAGSRRFLKLTANPLGLAVLAGLPANQLLDLDRFPGLH